MNDAQMCKFTGCSKASGLHQPRDLDQERRCEIASNHYIFYNVEHMFPTLEARVLRLMIYTDPGYSDFAEEDSRAAGGEPRARGSGSQGYLCSRSGATGVLQQLEVL